MVNLPDNDDRSGVVVGRKEPRGQQLDSGQIASHILKPDPPDRDKKQPSDDDCGGWRDVIPANHPDIKVGGVIEHQVEHWIVAGQGKGPLDETPSGAAKPAKDEDRNAPFHGVFLRRVSRQLGVCVRSFVRSLPAGINWTEATPKGGVQGMEHGLEHAPPTACRTSGNKGGVASVPLVPAGAALACLSTTAK